MMPFANFRTPTLLSSILHMEGANTATAFTDDNPFYTWTSGGGQTSTTQAKFGSTSLHIVGNEGIKCNQSTDPMFQPDGSDFTWEGWIFQTSNNAFATVFSTNNNGGKYNLFRVSNTNVIQYQNWSGAGISINGTTTVTTNAWHHMAVVRSGSSYKIFLDGNQEGSASSSATIGPTGVAFSVGYDSVALSSPFVGFIDECRFSLLARYSGNFTAPTAPFVLP